MKIIKCASGFCDKQEQNKDMFFKSLAPLKGTRVLFRGFEPGPFHKGYLKDFGGETVEFWNGIADIMSSEEWVYPCWEVMIAVPE